MKQLSEAGDVRILAVNALERADAFPDVPTVSGAGYALAWILLSRLAFAPPPAGLFDRFL